MTVRLEVQAMTVIFERKCNATSTLHVQAVYDGQVVADCDFCGPGSYAEAGQLLALNPVLHRLTNWLLCQNDDLAKKDIVMRGALLVISGSVELVDHQHPHWRNGEFEGQWTRKIKGRILGAKFNHLVEGWQPDEWSCRCQNAPWLPVSRLPISGMRKPDCCCHEVAWWLAGHLTKRGAGRRAAGSGNSLGYSRIVPAARVLSLSGTPVAKVHPYLIWRYPGQTVKGEYQPVTYCLVRPFGNGKVGVVVEFVNPGRQWRKAVERLMRLAATLNAERDNL
jgi:hypothetical protein